MDVQATMDAHAAGVGQQQMQRDAATSQQAAQNAGIVDQTNDSVKRMANGAADMAGGAASGVLGIAQGAALGAANVAEGAAGAVKNTFGNNPEMASHQNQATMDAQATAGQQQLDRDAATSHQQQPAQNAGIVNQTNDSVKRMAHGAVEVAGGAASGVLGIAQGVAMGAANVADGAAGAVKKTFGNNPGSS